MTDYDLEARQRFLDQFEPTRDGYIYRKHAIGAAIQVSASERDKYVDQFVKFQKYGKRGMFTGLVLLTLAWVTYGMLYNTEPSNYSFYIGIGLITFGYMAYHFWVWGLPQHELRGRGSISPALTRAEARRQHFAKLSYGQLVGFAVIALGPLIKIVLSKNDLFSGWNWLWLAWSVFIVACAAFGAFQKWKLERS